MVGNVITEQQYKSWRKGGVININVSISDTIPSTEFQIDQGCPNGTCSWAYSTSINVPPSTCILQFIEIGPESCYAPYYGMRERPRVVLIAGAYKSLENGDVYRARLRFVVTCPFLYYMGGGCWGEMCTNTGFTFANTAAPNGVPNPPDIYNAANVPFLGATFYYTNRVDDAEGNARSTASLSLTFTPNP
jgi:hypothetical protein